MSNSKIQQNITNTNTHIKIPTFNIRNNPNQIKSNLSNISAPSNKKLDYIYSVIKQRQQMKADATIPDPDKMTFNQFKSSIIVDTYDMFNDLFTLRNINKSNLNNIMDKNYRKITLFIILLIFIIAIKSIY